MDCTKCSKYNAGRGKKDCLQCKKYIHILKTSVKRSQIALDVVTDAVLHNIPDQQQSTVYDAMRQLPLEYSAPLILYCVLDCNQREIAHALKISQQQASKKIKIAIEIIKQMPVFVD